MKKLTLGIVAACLGVSAYADTDDQYAGIHVTLPFSLDGVGIQFIGRYKRGEVRAGYDTRSLYQAGLGFTGGDSDSFVPSVGAAYSSHHVQIVPYLGGRWGDDETEYGLVSYAGDLETTYAFVGHKLGWDNDDNGNSGAGADTPSPDDNGDTGGGSGSDGGGDNTTGGDTGGGSSGTDGNGNGDTGGSAGGGDTGSGGSGSDDNGSGDNGTDDGHKGNKSGLGDGTNPGKGEDHHKGKNEGTDNPSH